MPCERAVVGEGDVVAPQVRVPLADHLRVGRPVEEHADRPAQLAGRHGRRGADEPGAVLLAAEAAADLLDADRHLVGLDPQRAGDLRLVAVGVLRRVVDRHLVVRAGDRQGADRLEVEVRLGPGLELAARATSSPCRRVRLGSASQSTSLPARRDQDVLDVLGVGREPGGRIDASTCAAIASSSVRTAGRSS